jgi:hypothetical protein
MGLRPYAAFLLFLGSYLPLSVILLVQNFEYELWGAPLCWPLSSTCVMPLRQPMLSVSFVAVCFVCFLFTLLVLRAIKPRQSIEVLESKHIPADLMNYVLPYVVAFMGIDYNDIGKFIGFLVFLSWMFLVTFKSERVIINPALSVFGWKLHEVKYRSPGGQVVLTSMALYDSTSTLAPSQAYKAQSVQDVLIIK